MIKRITNADLLDYAAGVLPASGQRRIERALAADPDLRERLTELQGLSSAVREMYTPAQAASPESRHDIMAVLVRQAADSCRRRHHEESLASHERIESQTESQIEAPAPLVDAWESVSPEPAGRHPGGRLLWAGRALAASVLVAALCGVAVMLGGSSRHDTQARLPAGVGSTHQAPRLAPSEHVVAPAVAPASVDGSSVRPPGSSSDPLAGSSAGPSAGPSEPPSFRPRLPSLIGPAAVDAEMQAAQRSPALGAVLPGRSGATGPIRIERPRGPAAAAATPPAAVATPPASVVPAVPASVRQRVYLLPGDVNRDGRVDARDLRRLRSAIVAGRAILLGANADVNGDGRRDLGDLMQLEYELSRKAARP